MCKKIAVLIMLVGILAACATPIVPVPVAPTRAALTPVEIQSAATSIPATAAPNPTPTVSEPSAHEATVSFGPLSLVLPSGLASGISGDQFPRNDGQDLPYWEVTPGHTVLKLEGYPLQGKFHQPQIFIYPAQAYAEMVPGAFESIHRLDNILYGPSAPISVEQLPAVPFFNAQQVFASNVQQVSFQNGGGVRFVTEYAQYPASANNHDLFYHFQGVSRDGAYYIIAILPISLPVLAETSDAGAALPPGGVPYPDITAPNPDMAGYNSAVTNLLNAQSPEAFAPTINQLDSLIQSMQVAPLPPTVEPTMAIPDPVAPALNSQPPASCVVAGQQMYVNAFDGYCFAYPARFELQTSPTGQPQLFGSALDQNADALRASMAVEVEVAAKDARLSEIVDRYLQQFAGMNIPAITRTPIVLGGEPAEMLEVVPGREGSRDVVLLHDGTLYHFMFMPSVRDFLLAKNDVEELYNAVTQSFSFTSKKPRQLPTPEVSASPRDPGVSGVARWGTTPIEHATVELRTGDWRVNPNAVLQSATTDPEGRYFMANPPAGDYVMCGLFPEGVQERSTCTPVHIEAGQDVAGIDVMLLRTVGIVAPPVDVLVVARPTLSWASFPNAAQYEVFVIDAGTTELVQRELVADTHIVVTAPLQPGRTYDWVVNAIAADGSLLADGESRFVMQP
jgi:hypothetical protein